MKINDSNPVDDLQNLLCHLFSLEIKPVPLNCIDKFPFSLKRIYEIDRFFAEHNCGFETIRFFENMDRLTKFEKLDLEQDKFVFLTENQGNWHCKASLSSEKVFIDNHELFKKEEVLLSSLEELLVSFALQEVSYNLEYLIGLEYDSLEEFSDKVIQIEDLWVNKTYINRSVSFYLIDEDILFDSSMMTLASNNKGKIEFYKTKLNFFQFD
jgi:hypothetical protein